MEVIQGRVTGERVRGSVKVAEAADGAVGCPIGRSLRLHSSKGPYKLLHSGHHRSTVRDFQGTN